MIIGQTLPIPQDIQLPIPGDVGWLMVLLIIVFILHIVFVNLTISLATGAVVLEGIGMMKKNKRLDKIAQICSFHASIHKSIAVVLGVGPLLLVSVIYTQYFYSSTILVGKAWLSVIILLIIAFILLYIYKFTWGKMERKKGLHLIIGVSASLILLFIPLIFIVNIVSMLHPDKWMVANGFFDSLFVYPQIWQRYFHFILASFAAGGFYLFVFYAYKKKRKPQRETAEVEKDIRKLGVKSAFWMTLAQFISGSLVLMSLDQNVMKLYMGEDGLLTGLFIFSIISTFILLGFLYMTSKNDSNRAFIGALSSFILVLSLMGWMRHEVRESYLKPYINEHPRTELSANSD